MLHTASPVQFCQIFASGRDFGCSPQTLDIFCVIMEETWK